MILLRKIGRRRTHGDNNAAYSLIWVSVARGFTEEVVHAAREAESAAALIKEAAPVSMMLLQIWEYPNRTSREFVVILAEKDKNMGL